MTELASSAAKTSVWLVNVVTNIPKFLRLYFSLLTDNRVSSKAKVVIVTTVALLGAQFALGGVVYKIQLFLTKMIGPWAFIPSGLIALITLDICQRLISADVFEKYEKQIFGESYSLEADINRLREFLGPTYDKLMAFWERKADHTEAEMKQADLIVNGEMTDAAVQEVAEQIVELETSEALSEKIDEHVKMLQQSDDATKQVRLELLEKISKD